MSTAADRAAWRALAEAVPKPCAVMVTARGNRMCDSGSCVVRGDVCNYHKELPAHQRGLAFPIAVPALLDELEALEAERDRLRDALAIATTPHPSEEWHEDDGDVLWWAFPIVEPPYLGSQLNDDWPGDEYFTHWTRLILPEAP